MEKRFKLNKSIGYEDYKELIHTFRDLINDKFGDSIISLVLYGSVARSEAKNFFLKDGSWYWDLKPDLLAGEVFEL